MTTPRSIASVTRAASPSYRGYSYYAYLERPGTLA
jgi:hypothetical protein